MAQTAAPVRVAGELIELRDLSKDDYPAMCEIWCDPLVTRHTASGQMTPDEVGQYLTELIVAAQISPRQRYGLALVRRQDQALVGSIELDLERHRAGYLHSLAVRPRYGAAIAHNAMSLIAEFAFNQLGLHRLWGGCDPGNGAANRLFSIVGCTRQGLIREFYLKDSIWRDIVVWDMVEREFRKFPEVVDARRHLLFESGRALTSVIIDHGCRPE